MGKVLVVDDDAGIALLLQRLISKKGHQITVARNGKEGLACAQAEVPDLVFTDVRMPDLNGLDLATLIRADPRLEHIPIVILSGTAYLIDLKDTAADAILTKPFDLKSVYALLEQFLGHSDPISEGGSSGGKNFTREGGKSRFKPLTDPPDNFSASPL